MTRRVISLVPAATEIVHALGASTWLVGRSHECDFPPGIEALVALTESVVDPAGSSREINDDVAKRQRAGQSLYRLNEPLLRELKPDVILTQGQCAVCAISEADLQAALQGWAGPKPKVVSLAPSRFADLWADMASVAAALGLEDRLPAVIGPLKQRVVEIIGKTGAMTKRPRMACIEWIDPVMLAGNWTPDLVQLAGGDPVGPRPGEHSGWMKGEELVAAKPDVVVLMPCGMNQARARQEAASLEKIPGWYSIPAVKRARIYVTDGNALFNRPGPRLVDSLEALAQILYPSVFESDEKNRLWARL